MRRCLDEDDALAFHKAASLWIPGSVRLALFAIDAHLPFPGRGVELSGVLDVHEGSGSDDAKVREIGFLAVKHLDWRLHLERLIRSPVLEVRRRHEQLPPHRRWKTTVCEHAPNHGAQSSPHAFGHTDLLRRVGGGELLNNTGLQAILRGVLAALVGAPTNDAAAEGNNRRADEQLKRLESSVLVDQQVDGGPLGVLVGYLADFLVAAYGHWREGPRQVSVAQLERPADLVVGCFGVSELLSFSHGANFAVRGSPLECDPSAVSLTWNIQALCMEMTPAADATPGHWRLRSLLDPWRHIGPHSSPERTSRGHRSRSIVAR